jgi:hypothetical protein
MFNYGLTMVWPQLSQGLVKFSFFQGLANFFNLDKVYSSFTLTKV